MIEIVYSKENEKKEDYLRLPKNIRQIGIPDETRKIYIEDYAITFINQFAAKCVDEPKAAVLVGSTTYHNSCEYIFVSGVLEVENIRIGTESIEFSEKTWTGIYNNIKKYFPNQDIVGWFLSSQAFHRESSDPIIKAHIDNFAGSDKVFMKIDPLENEEIFYIFQNGHFVRQMGYYIYYEKNEEMQEYMVQGKEKNKEQEEPHSLEQVEDHAAKSFRTIIQERKDEKHQKKMNTFMYTTSTFLVMLLVVLGITMINNYDRMKNMEQTLNMISKVVNEEDKKIATDWFAKNSQDNTQNSNDEQAASNEQETTDASNNQTQEVMNQPAIPVENVSGNVEKQDDTAKDATDQTPADQASQDQAAQDQAATTQPPADQATQSAGGVVTEVTKTEEEMQQTLKDSGGQLPKTEEKAEKAAEPKTYTVKKGDTLAKISLKLYNNQDMVAKICELNNIKNDNKIQAGQTLIIP